APRERGDDLGDPQAEYRRDANNHSCNHAALRVRGSAPVEIGVFTPPALKSAPEAARADPNTIDGGCREARMSSTCIMHRKNLGGFKFGRKHRSHALIEVVDGKDVQTIVRGG